MIEKNPVRYKTPDELSGQIEREKKYNQRAERNVITGGAPPLSRQEDTLDRQMAQNNDLKKNYGRFFQGEGDKSPLPTPKSYKNMMQRGQNLLANSRNQLNSEKERGINRTSRMQTIAANPLYKKASQQFFDDASPIQITNNNYGRSESQNKTPTQLSQQQQHSPYQQSGAKEKNPDQRMMNAGLPRQSFQKNKMNFYDNPTPRAQQQRFTQIKDLFRMKRKIPAPKVARYNPNNFESQLVDGTSYYAYQKNKANFYDLPNTGIPNSKQYNFTRASNAFFGTSLDSGPAFKGKDHSFRYDPYRDSTIGNVKSISPAPSNGRDLSPYQQKKRNASPGAFALF